MCVILWNVLQWIKRTRHAFKQTHELIEASMIHINAAKIQLTTIEQSRGILAAENRDLRSIIKAIYRGEIEHLEPHKHDLINRVQLE